MAFETMHDRVRVPSKLLDMLTSGTAVLAGMVAVPGKQYALLTSATACMPAAGMYESALSAVAMMVDDADRDAFADHLALPCVLHALESADVYEQRFRISSIWHEIRFCFMDAQRTDLLFAVCDIHARLEAEEAALRQHEQNRRAIAEALAIASHANQTKRAFLSSVTEALYGPISAIFNLTASAQLHISDEPQRAFLKQIDAAADELKSLVDDCLDAMRGAQRIASLRVERFPLSSLWGDAEKAERLAASHGCAFERDLAGMPETEVIGSAAAMSRIILAVTKNAVRRAGTGGTVRFACSEKHQDDNMIVLRLEISDSGQTPSVDQLAQAFEPFTQGASPYTGTRADLELDMAICKRYADAIGATLAMRALPKVGAMVAVDIPLQIAVRKAEPSAMERERRASLAGRRILLAEDNLVNAEITTALLEMHGLIVNHAENGRIAAELFERSAPGYYDAVLMDVHMPVMNGMESTLHIRAANHPDCARVPIIALSASAFHEDLARALDSGVNDYVHKPIELEKLLSALRVHIARNAVR